MSHDLQLWCQIMLAVGFVTWPTTIISETDGLNIFISEIDRHMYKVYKMLQIMGLERKQQLI